MFHGENVGERLVVSGYCNDYVNTVNKAKTRMQRGLQTQ